jgi:lysophospholipase L1-like esterase
MLGTNDTKSSMGLDIPEIAAGMRRLAEMARAPQVLLPIRQPQVLITAPVPLGEHALVDPAHTDEDALRKSRELAGVYASLAEELGCAFLDLGSIACTELVDGVHLSADAHRAAAAAFAEKIRSLSL